MNVKEGRLWIIKCRKLRRVSSCHWHETQLVNSHMLQKRIFLISVLSHFPVSNLDIKINVRRKTHPISSHRQIIFQISFMLKSHLSVTFYTSICLMLRWKTTQIKKRFSFQRISHIIYSDYTSCRGMCGCSGRVKFFSIP